MATEYLITHNGCHWKTVEAIIERLPQLTVVSSYTCRANKGVFGRLWLHG